MKRRRLGDLYVRGKALSVSDGEGEPVKVWLAKLNEVDREASLRRANAAKARFLMDAAHEDSEGFAAAYGEVRDVDDREELILFVIADELVKSRRAIEAERVGDEESWGKDDYLQGLLDAWNGDDENPGLSKAKEEDPDDPEAERVWLELGRFQDEVQAEIRADTDRRFKDWEDVELEDLRRKAAHKLVELRAADEFIKEFRRQQLFYAVREPNDHRKRYFATVAEIDDLDSELRDHLQNQYEELIVDRTEGKDSPRPAASSNSSASVDPASGPVEVSA